MYHGLQQPKQILDSLPCFSHPGYDQQKKDDRTLINIPDDLWDEIKTILPKEKPPKPVG
ncbi:MAG TPA: hypothetical protein VJL78_02940 [Candidatus Nitrosocosmicus sp.]|nr:hypothetical protein [Candidatus Nitrosocosmicus sp.]